MGREFQMSLFKMKSQKTFGGSLLKKSNPKVRRPVSTKHAMHVVIKSSRAKGSYSFLRKKNRQGIDKILKAQAKKFGIRIYRYENVGNHIHILLKTGHRRWLAHFLRSITGLIAREVTGANRGARLSGKFWDLRPFSRIVEWGRSYKNLQRYFDKNRLQAVGFERDCLDSKCGKLLLDSG